MNLTYILLIIIAIIIFLNTFNTTEHFSNSVIKNRVKNIRDSYNNIDFNNTEVYTRQKIFSLLNDMKDLYKGVFDRNISFTNIFSFNTEINENTSNKIKNYINSKLSEIKDKQNLNFRLL